MQFIFHAAATEANQKHTEQCVWLQFNFLFKCLLDIGWVRCDACVWSLPIKIQLDTTRLPTIHSNRAILIGHEGKLKNDFSCCGWALMFTLYFPDGIFLMKNYILREVCVVQKRIKLGPYEENTCSKQLFDNIFNENWLMHSKTMFFNGKHAVNSIFHIYTVWIYDICSMWIYQSMFVSCFTSFLSIFRVLIEFIDAWQGNIVFNDWIQVTTAKRQIPKQRGSLMSYKTLK